MFDFAFLYALFCFVFVIASEKFECFFLMREAIALRDFLFSQSDFFTIFFFIIDFLE